MAGPSAPPRGRRSWKSKFFIGLLVFALLGTVGYLTYRGFNATFKAGEEADRLRAEGRTAVLACAAELAACRDEEVKALIQDLVLDQYAAGEAAGLAAGTGEATTAYHQGRAEARAEVLARAASVISGEVPAESLTGDEAVLRYALEALIARQQLEALQAATPPPPTPTPTATVPPPSPTPRP